MKRLAFLMEKTKLDRVKKRASHRRDNETDRYEYAFILLNNILRLYTIIVYLHLMKKKKKIHETNATC